MKKRLFTLALALMLCLSLMPMAALAAEEESAAPVEEMVEETIEETIEETAEPVALALDGEATPVTITSGNLSDHVSAEAPYGATVYKFKNGDNFKLGEPIDLSTEDSSLNINTDITLDLNGHTLTLQDLSISGTLTLTDSSGESGGLVITNDGAYIQGTLKANGGTVKGKITVNKDSVIASDGTPTVFEGSVTLNGEIKGGVFKKDITISVSNPTISGGTFYGDIGYTNSNPCNITGGTFYGGVSDCTISGGIFYGTIEDDCAVAGDTDELVFMNGSSTYAVVVVPNGSTATKPDDPTVPENQRFTGWYKDVDCNTLFDFATTVNSDTTLFAGFESTVASATVTGKTGLGYTGEPQTLVEATDVKNGVVLYSLDESGTYSETVPTGTNAGSYTVYYKLTPNEGYTGGSEASVDVTIAPKDVTVSGITAENKTYDGDATATLNYDAATIGGKVDGDALSVSATGAFSDENAGDGKTVSISGLTLGGTAANNYALASSGQQTTTTANIAPKSVSAIVTVAEGPYTYTGSEIKPDVTVKDGETTIPAGEYTVSYSDNINAGTAKVSVTNKDGGNYIVSGSATFAIGKAAASATVTGKTLTYTGEAQELVTESDVKGGRVLYNVNIGDTYEETVPTGKNVGSYIIDWYVEGDSNHESTKTERVTVTIAVPADVGDAVKDMTVDTVTGDDRETIETTQKTVNDYLAMSPTEAEKTTLNALKDTLEKMIERLDEVKAALESKTIADADDITKNDVKTGDKKTLENAKAAIEKLMEDYKDNLTATEQRTLNIKLERIGDALDEIAVLEKKNAEKDKANSVAQTGDSATPILWIVIVVAAVAAVVVLLVVRKKKSK